MFLADDNLHLEDLIMKQEIQLPLYIPRDCHLALPHALSSNAEFLYTEMIARGL